MNSAGIRQAVIDALKNKTAAEERVYSPSDWPTDAGEYPALLVQTPLDSKTAIGSSAPQFTTVTTVSVTGRLQSADDEATQLTTMAAETALETLREQVERAVINSYALTRQIQRFVRVRSTIDSSTRVQQLLVEMELEYYQGPEDFYPVETIPLEGFNVTVAMPDGTTSPLLTLNTTE